MGLEQAVLEKLRTLPTDRQQQVLDFVEFLQIKVGGQKANPPEMPEVSFLEAAHEFIGCVEGPGDLSTNPAYMEGYGQS